MHKRYIKITYIIGFLITVPFLLFAAPVANLHWYNISYLELPSTGNNLYNNSIDIQYEHLANVHFLGILTGMEAAPPAGYGSLKIRFNAPGGVFRFVKVTDSTKMLNVTLRLRHENQITQSVVPMIDYPIVAGNLGSAPTVTNLFMDVANPPNNGQPYRGNYYFPLEIQIIDNDGYVLVQKTLHLFLHFYYKDSPADPVTTFTLERYGNANFVPIPYPYQGGTSILKVGMVNFQSNEGYNAYRLKISPVGQRIFQFNHTNPSRNAAIQYRVTIPGRTSYSYDQSFEFNLDYKGTIGAWYDALEIGVRDINYNNVRGTSGSYASIIRIELISM